MWATPWLLLIKYHSLSLCIPNSSNVIAVLRLPLFTFEAISLRVIADETEGRIRATAADGEWTVRAFLRL